MEVQRVDLSNCSGLNFLIELDGVVLLAAIRGADCEQAACAPVTC